jgi:hypothetical protein
MRPVAFLEFAVSCAAGSPSEAALRSAISRAYYAAWLQARAYLREQEIALIAVAPGGRRLGGHEQVIETLALIDARDARRMRSRLNNLRRLRSRADYDLEDAVILTRSGNAITLAQAIIEWIDRLDS